MIPPFPLDRQTCWCAAFVEVCIEDRRIQTEREREVKRERERESVFCLFVCCFFFGGGGGGGHVRNGLREKRPETKYRVKGDVRR